MSERHKIDLVTFEILRHRLWEINDEMAMLAARISGSPAVYESSDFNTAILTAKGEGLFTGVYVIRQASALDVLVQAVIEQFGNDLHDGDMFMTNDPWSGALHAMDYAVVAPVFWKDEVVCWTGVVMHEIDVGGPRPGSWTVGARDAFQECMLIPPVKVVEKGRLQKDIEKIYLRNTRTPDMNALNLRAKIAAQVTTRERLHDIIREYGKDTFIDLQHQILDYVRTSLRRRISKLPDGVWYSHAFLDHDGVEDRMYRFKLKLTKTGEKLIFDFTGTSEQARGAINSAYSGLIGGVVQTIFPLLCFDLPWSHGAVADCIEIISEPGTVNNATFPAATSMATVNSCQITGNVIWEAFSRMFSCVDELREEVSGLCYGGVAMAVLAGKRANNTTFVNMFTDSVGGGGARSYRDGIDTCGNSVAPGYAIPNAERIEALFPVLYVYRKERPETAGAGIWRGGVGIEYMLTPHNAGSDIEAIFFGSATAHCETKGAAGGYPGSVQRSIVLRDTDIASQFAKGVIPLTDSDVKATIELPEAKDTASLRPSDAWVCFCDGGGGYGDPLDRDPENVRLDVLRGLCTKDEGKRLYGVELTGDLTVNLQSTTALRDGQRKQRMAKGRRLGDAWQPGTAFDGEQLFRYGEILAVRKTKAGPAIGCIKCGNALCAAGEDPRQRSLLVEQELSALSPLNRYGRESEVVIRHYCCPGCARVFSTDVQLKTDDPKMPEMVLNEDYFAKMSNGRATKDLQPAAAG